MTVGGDQLHLSQRQTVDGIDLDDIDDTTGGETDADLIARQGWQSAIRARRAKNHY